MRRAGAARRQANAASLPLDAATEVDRRHLAQTSDVGVGHTVRRIELDELGRLIHIGQRRRGRVGTSRGTLVLRLTEGQRERVLALLPADLEAIDTRLQATSNRLTPDTATGIKTLRFIWQQIFGSFPGDRPSSLCAYAQA